MVAKHPPPNNTLAEQLFHIPIAPISHLQETAMSLFLLGLNVFPVPFGRKGGWPWRMLQYTRLNPEDIYLLFSGRCNMAIMCGRTSGNLFVIDCETNHTFKYQEHMLQKAGIPIWAVKSGGREGGGHFYLKCNEGEVKGIRPGERPDLEVRGNRSYVLAPPSVHPETRNIYNWHKRETAEPPEVTLEHVHWLSLTLTKDSPKEKTPQPFSKLSNATQDFLLNGAEQGTRNNRLFAAACDLAGNNYSHHAAIQLLIPIGTKAGLPEREIRDTINSAFSRKRTPAKLTSGKHPSLKPHERAILWAQEQPWKGKSGQTDKAILLACCTRAALSNNNGVFRAASRELAEPSRVTRKTASKGLKRLVTAKYLIPCGTDATSGANLYRLSKITQNTSAINSRIYPTTTYPGFSNGVVSQKTDAVENGALGKTAYSVYKLMSGLEKPVKAKELVELSKLSIHQVYRALQKLKVYKLVDKSEGGYHATPLTDDALDEQVARPAGTLGKADKRRETHERERASAAASRIFKARRIKRKQDNIRSSKPQRWVCGNCGQMWGSVELAPPLICEYCSDCTTWKPV